MADIRIVRKRGSRLWMLTGALAALSLLVWGSVFFLGDPTAPEEARRAGALADFGAERAPVLPAEPVPFRTMRPVTERDLGALVRLQGRPESGVRANAVFVRADDGRRILVRIQPPPPEGAASGLVSGGRVDASGYIQRIAWIEYEAWVQDSLGVRIPRPRPARKFGDFPDTAFVALDTLYIRDFYLSVRPEALRPDDG